MRSDYAGARTFLLWNTSIPNPLCWRLRTENFGRDWEIVDPRQGKSLPYPRTTDAIVAAHASLKRHPISHTLFEHGHVDRLLSPVLEVDIPSQQTGDFFSITASLSNYVFGVWLTWNAGDERWQYETRDLAQIIELEYEQPTEFISWQEEIFHWVRRSFSDWIVPRYTYRLGAQDPKESLGRLAQELADLLGKNVAGFDPRDPVVPQRAD